MSAPRWVVRAASRPECGAGHVSRSAVLARALSRAAEVELILDPGDALWRERLAGEPFAVRDADDAGDGALAGAVVDSYDLREAEWRALRRRAAVLAQLDDLFAPRPEIDLAINAAPHLEGQAMAGRPALLGPAYALIDPRYVAIAREAAERTSCVLVTFGAVDQPNATELALDALAKADLGVRIVVALGPEAPHLPRVRAAAKALDAELLIGASSLLEPLSRADLAIGAGGVSLLERMAAGVPSVSLAVAANQRAQLEGAARRGATRHLGDVENVSPTDLAEAVRALATDREARARMAERARALVDGRGAERVARRLAQLAPSHARAAS